MRILTDREQIFEAYRLMIMNFQNKSVGRLTQVGHKGGNSPTVVFWREDLKTWVCPGHRPLASRYWIAWGINKPYESGSSNIICETNIAIEGHRGGLGSRFAESPAGEVFLMHNGNIKGGRRGIGPNAFWKHFENHAVYLTYPNGTRHKAAMIGSIASEGFSQLIADFVHEVARIKKVVTE